MSFFGKLGQFTSWAGGTAGRLAPIVSTINPAVGMGMSSVGNVFGGGGAAAMPGGASTGLGGIFTPASMGSSLPNLGIYSPPGGLPKPSTGAAGIPVQEASVGTAIVAGSRVAMKALSPAARWLARNGPAWVRRNWTFIASAVGASVLSELTQWLLAGSGAHGRRMNVLNPRALNRAIRRTHGFARYARRVVTIQRGVGGVKFKAKRRGRRC